MAPAAGFEPATKWLTATYSTAELCRNLLWSHNIGCSFKKSNQIHIKKWKLLVLWRYLIEMSYKNSHSAEHWNGAASSWHTPWFWCPHISTLTRSAPSLHYPNIVPARPCWSECHEPGVPLDTPSWGIGSLDPNGKSPVSHRNPDNVRNIAHILKEGTWKRVCFLIDYSDQTVIKRKESRPWEM